MEERAREAAQISDIEALYELIRDKTDVLSEMAGKEFFDTPLRVAAAGGQTESETALSLFTVNNDCPECIHDVTNRNDTALHLAARPGKLKAFRVLRPCLWSSENMSSNKSCALLVVTTLILTTTYQAALSPPGGVFQAEAKPKTTPHPLPWRSIQPSVSLSSSPVLSLSVFFLVSSGSPSSFPTHVIVLAPSIFSAGHITKFRVHCYHVSEHKQKTFAKETKSDTCGLWDFEALF
ncbi:hypothetical protein Gogos_003873 [Gossypium gossypioides]|uniref:PGG domain-containing protein n=1 Tax=Gossypium gossypioides TaxID=34282 RepID=A0A7J9CP78_GOSGO|nr:hypothetical protein [Gossypium gossypioides]